MEIQQKNDFGKLWSARLRKSDIGIAQNTVFKAYQSQSWSTGIIAKDILSEDYEHSWSIKATVGNEIVVGMCIKKSATTHNFTAGNHWFGVGNGHYVASSNGFIGKHTELTLDPPKTQIRFKSGAIVNMRYQPTDQIFQISVLNQEIQSFRQVKFLVEKPINPESCYRMCVYLTRLDDKVQLLQYTRKKLGPLSKESNKQTVQIQKLCAAKEEL